MKIRSGFVSNSSSSSFIVGIGLIRPGKEKEVAEIFGESNIKSVLEEIANSKNNQWYSVPRVTNSGKIFSVESFDGRVASVYSPLDDLTKLGEADLKVVVFDENGDEPDYDEDACEYNYDDFDYPDAFDEEQQKKYYLLNNNRDLFLQGEAICGAGYDG